MNLTANSNATSGNETDYDDAVGANDDEMFLDADGELGSEVAIDTGLPIKRKAAKGDQDVQSHKHIVFKRKPEAEDGMSDYGLWDVFFVCRLVMLVLFCFCSFDGA